MHQTADASGKNPIRGRAHIRHVIPSRNHAETISLYVVTQSLIPNPVPASAWTSTTRRADPNQTLCLPGSTRVDTATAPYNHTRDAMSSPHPQTALRQPWGRIRSRGGQGRAATECGAWGRLASQLRRQSHHGPPRTRLARTRLAAVTQFRRRPSSQLRRQSHHRPPRTRLAAVTQLRRDPHPSYAASRITNLLVQGSPP